MVTLTTMGNRITQKRAQQASLIPDEWRLPAAPLTTTNALEVIRSSKILSPKEKEITETTDTKVLLGRIATKDLTSVEVTTAFAKRTALAHQLTNCCTEIFFQEALESARAADDYLARTGKTLGPLHGLPISVKDVFRVKGQDTTVGWVALSGKPAPEDGTVVYIVRKLGAIPYVKSNVPQSMMMSDSYNHLFGQCVNTLNTKFISGGSSGGESSLISSLGSVIGIGTDIGGSIRIPASACGIYGLCPSAGRHPHEQFGPRQQIIRSIAGPMANDLSSIETYMEALVLSEPWNIDPGLVPVPWRRELCNVDGNKRLRIGYVIDDGVVEVQPPIARAVKKIVDILAKAGHEVFEWDASIHKTCNDLWSRGVMSDGGEGCRKMCAISGEPLIEGMIVGTEKDLLTTTELHELLYQKHNLETHYLRTWQTANIDALITPVMPWVGYAPKTFVSGPQYVGYTSVWNLVNYASLVIPAGVVDVDAAGVNGNGDTATDTAVAVNGDTDGGAGGDDDWTQRKPRNASDQFNQKQYKTNINNLSNLPIGIQIIGGKFGEEKCIAVAKVVESLMKQEEKGKGNDALE